MRRVVLLQWLTLSGEIPGNRNRLPSVPGGRTAVLKTTQEREGARVLCRSVSFNPETVIVRYAENYWMSFSMCHGTTEFVQLGGKASEREVAFSYSQRNELHCCNDSSARHVRLAVVLSSSELQGTSLSYYLRNDSP